MSQIYAPAQMVSTPEEKETAFSTENAMEREGIDPAEKITNVASTCIEKGNEETKRAMEEHQQMYATNQEILLNAIDGTSAVVKELRQFSKDRWIIHYPDITTSVATASVANTIDDVINDKENVAIHPGFQRAATYQHDAAPIGTSVSRTINMRKIPNRSETSRDMSVLKLDLKVGPANKTPSALVHTLEKSSIAQLLDGRFAQSLTQLEHMKKRVSDKQSKVLVTGDLNAGKSTYVNALLRRKVMPTDQQPCTTVFCEVVDAEGNQGREIVHMLKKGVLYDMYDETSFTEHSLDDIEQIVIDAEEVDADDAPIIKCYCNDIRNTEESLLRNGIVDIALIDAPGLNTDSVKTTNLFARQDEIDVVVFVVSAENHFTLSAKEFLWNASNDKAYVFIVVNKYDQIRNKERCRQRVLEQIRQLSPRTYEDAKNLVHFVDSSAVLQERKEGEVDPDFNQMESALRDFVLHKRSVSKLQPAQTYLLRVLFDIAFLAKTNTTIARREMKEAKEALAVARPLLQKVQINANKLENQLEGEEDGVVGGIVDGAKARLEEALLRVSKGQPADSSVPLPEYPGLLHVWDYARQVRETMIVSLELAVRSVEDLARDCTKEAVDRIRVMGEKHLPEDAGESNRVFLPEAMFAKRRTRTSFAGLGLGPELVQVKISDIFDAKHHIMVITGMDDNTKKDQEEETSLISSVSLGLGAVTLLGGKAFGAKTAVDLFVRISDIVGNPTARKWALPVFIIASTGLVAWTIIDLPYSIPRNIGRNVSKELQITGGKNVSSNKKEQENATTVITTIAPVYSFTEIQSRRISRDSRKVLRLAGYDLGERFRVAIAARKQEVKEQEKKEEEASVAMKWLEGAGKRVVTLQKELENLKGIRA